MIHFELAQNLFGLSCCDLFLTAGYFSDHFSILIQQSVGYHKILLAAHFVIDRCYCLYHSFFFCYIMRRNKDMLQIQTVRNDQIYISVNSAKQHIINDLTLRRYIRMAAAIQSHC